MGKIHGRNASIYADDQSAACMAISGDLNSATLSYQGDAPDVTGFGDNTRQRLPDGIIEWELSVNGFYSTTADTAAACVLFPIVSGSTYIQYGPAGSTAGQVKYTGCAILTEFSQELGVEDAATFSATFVSRSGSLSASQW